MKHIKQTTNDCSLACIAMVSGNTLEAVTAMLSRPIAEGLYLEELRLLLQKCGVAHIQYLDCILVSDRTYIISIPSFTFKGSWHNVVIQTFQHGAAEVYDPLKESVELVDMCDFVTTTLIHEVIEVFPLV